MPFFVVARTQQAYRQGSDRSIVLSQFFRCKSFFVTYLISFFNGCAVDFLPLKQTFLRDVKFSFFLFTFFLLQTPSPIWNAPPKPRKASGRCSKPPLVPRCPPGGRGKRAVTSSRTSSQLSAPLLFRELSLGQRPTDQPHPLGCNRQLQARRSVAVNNFRPFVSPSIPLSLSLSSLTSSTMEDDAS